MRLPWLDPNSALAHNKKGAVLEELGRYEEAIEACEQAIRLDPNNAQAHDGKDVALKELRKATRRWLH